MNPDILLSNTFASLAFLELDIGSFLWNGSDQIFTDKKAAELMCLDREEYVSPNGYYVIPYSDWLEVVRPESIEKHQRIAAAAIASRRHYIDIITYVEPGTARTFRLLSYAFPTMIAGNGWGMSGITIPLRNMPGQGFVDTTDAVLETLGRYQTASNSFLDRLSDIIR